MGILLILGIKKGSPCLEICHGLMLFIGLVDHTSDRVVVINGSNYRWDVYSTKCAKGKV